MQELWKIYHHEIPMIIKEILDTKVLLRLKNVGMNCGLEYTRFKMFKDINGYSRYDHSKGVALIIYHFTGDIIQAIAGLLHDISTPVFAHTIDFMYNDHLNQEFTENNTGEFIASSAELLSILKKYDIEIDDICDYHRYPVADNEGFRLSSDRLEYSLGNMFNYNFCDLKTVRKFYDNLQIGINEDNQPELMFKDKETAKDFTRLVLKNSRVYVCDEDRYAMEFLAGIIRTAIDKNIIKESELYLNEQFVINKMKEDEEICALWEKFTKLTKVNKSFAYKKGYLKIMAKKRYIDPYVLNEGRVSDIYTDIKEEIVKFNNLNFDYYLIGE